MNRPRLAKATGNKAISLGVSALTVIILVLTVGFGLFIIDTFNATSTTNNTSGTNHVATSSTGLYQLSFNQTVICRPGTSLYGAYFIPWSVTLASGSSFNTTKVQPPNSNLSNGFTSTKNESYASISFSVADGTYNYTINPTNDFESAQTGASSGTLTINGNNVTINVHFNLASCGSTITTTALTTTTSSSSASTQNSSTQTPSSQETFNYATMPTSFTLGYYNFAMIYNGTGYEYSANGTGYMNMGFNLVLNVTSLQRGSSETVDFGWAPPAPQPYTLPTPSTASLFNGAVQMNWNSNTTGSSGTFLTVWIFSNVPNPSTSNSTSTMTSACTTTTTTFVNATVTQTATECVQ